MDYPIYTSRDLYGVMYDKRLESPSTYWLDLCFPGSFMSDKEEIIFEKITSRRHIAPFVLPTVPGKPTYKRDGSTVQMFRPAYIKPKDPVKPGEMLSRQPGDLFSMTPRSPKANFDAEVVKVTQYHRSIIQRRWEWLAARAAIDGSVVIAGDGYPSVTVDFNRASGHTVVKSSNYWTTTYDILGDIQAWADTMAASEFGGIANRLTVSPDVWAVMRKNEGIIAEMTTQRRGNPDINIATGLIQPNLLPGQAQYVGTLGAGIDVYVYRDYYVDEAGNQQKFLAAKTVVLTAPGVEGVKAFGAILDVNSLVPTDIFPKMWDENDPSARFIMSQSAPLMIPVNPNCTFKAVVLA